MPPTQSAAPKKTMQQRIMEHLQKNDRIETLYSLADNLSAPLKAVTEIAYKLVKSRDVRAWREGPAVFYEAMEPSVRDALRQLDGSTMGHDVDFCSTFSGRSRHNTLAALERAVFLGLATKHEREWCDQYPAGYRTIYRAVPPTLYE